MIRSVFFFACIFMLTNCINPTQKTESKVVISMEKSPCMGECPVYSLKVFDDQTVEYKGEKYTSLKGTYESKLTEKEYEVLINTFLSHDFFGLENRYVSNRSDLPSTSLYFAHNNKEKSVLDYDGAPKEVKDIETKLEELVKELKWEKVKE